MSNLENKSGVHSEEVYKSKGKGSTADKYAKAKELDFNMCANDYVIDANKRGKVQDITNGKFKMNEPSLTE